MTNGFSGRPARILVNRLAVGVGPILDAPLDFPLPMGELQLLRAKAEQQGSTDFTPFWSGQAAPGREIPAKALTVKLATEALKRFQQLGGLSKSGPSPLTLI
jgi:nitronate monooxygenase